jgi:two-component system, OmpR family, response regulator
MIRIAVYSVEEISVSRIRQVSKADWSIVTFDRRDEFVKHVKRSACDLCVLNFTNQAEISVLNSCRLYLPGTPIIVIADADSVARYLLAGATVVLHSRTDVEMLSLQIDCLLLLKYNRGISYHDLRWDSGTDRFFREGREIRLTVIQNSILKFLLTHREKCLSREQIIAGAWPTKRKYPSDSSVDKAISRLRSAVQISDKENPIKTVHGIGYRLEYRRQMPSVIVNSRAMEKSQRREFGQRIG